MLEFVFAFASSFLVTVRVSTIAAVRLIERAFFISAAARRSAVVMAIQRPQCGFHLVSLHPPGCFQSARLAETSFMCEKRGQSTPTTVGCLTPHPSSSMDACLQLRVLCLGCLAVGAGCAYVVHAWSLSAFLVRCTPSRSSQVDFVRCRMQCVGQCVWGANL